MNISSSTSSLSVKKLSPFPKGETKATVCFRFKVNRVPVVGTASVFGFLLCWCLKRRLSEEGVLFFFGLGEGHGEGKS